MRMAQFLTLFFAASLSVLGAPKAGGRIEYVGGTLPLKANAGGLIDATGPSRLLVRVHASKLEIPYERINLIEYGQKVSREYVAAVVVSPLFLLAKKRRHFLTLGFQDDEGRQQALVLRIDKNDVRSVLASLEARTGLKVTYQDEEARKAGKG